MKIGAVQSQSLISAATQAAGKKPAATSLFGASAQVTAARILSTDPEAPDEAVKLSVNRRIDATYQQRVLTDSVEDKLNTALEKAGLDMRAEDLLQEGLDVTPEATAARITEFATSFYGAYQENNPDVEGNVQIDGFVDMIKGAVEEGFEEAGEILSGIGRIPDQVNQDIDRTLELTMEGLDAFAEEQRALLEPIPEPAESDAEDADLLAI